MLVLCLYIYIYIYIYILLCLVIVFSLRLKSVKIIFNILFFTYLLFLSCIQSVCRRRSCRMSSVFFQANRFKREELYATKGTCYTWWWWWWWWWWWALQHKFSMNHMGYGKSNVKMCTTFLLIASTLPQ